MRRVFFAPLVLSVWKRVICFVFLFSFYSALEVSGNDNEQIVEDYHSVERSVKMQQTTTDSSLVESNIGVPNRFCSVCGDTSTGKHRCFSF